MLEIDLITILAEILNFLVVVIVLYFVLFKPTIKRIENRAHEKEALLQEAREKEQQADDKLSKIEERLSSIDAEIEKQLQEAYQQAQEESESLLEETEKEAEKILKEAEKEAAKRQKQEIEQLQDELVDTILSICGEVLSKAAPDVVHENLIEELNSEIWDLGKGDMRQVRAIRDSLAEREPTVFVTSAKELTPDQQRALIRTFSALADSNVNMEIELDPELIAGIRVRMGDLVVENTLAMELTELKSDVIGALEESVDGEV
jgi:F-type H+-transporting ATPase subunit b